MSWCKSKGRYARTIRCDDCGKFSKEPVTSQRDIDQICRAVRSYTLIDNIHECFSTINMNRSGYMIFRCGKCLERRGSLPYGLVQE